MVLYTEKIASEVLLWCRKMQHMYDMSQAGDDSHRHSGHPMVEPQADPVRKSWSHLLAGHPAFACLREIDAIGRS